MSSYEPSYVPRFVVDVDGEQFHEYTGEVTEVVADTTTDGADHCSFTLIHPFDHEQVDFDGLNIDDFEHGGAVEVKMGYGHQDDSLTTVFTGEIYSIEGSFPAGQPPSVRVSAYGPLHTMMQGTSSNTWEESSLKDVVTDLSQPYFDETTIEKATIEKDAFIQNDQNDYRYVSSLADKYGFECFSSLGEFFFRPTDGSTREELDTKLYFGETLESFTVEESTANQIGSVTVRHWDDEQQEAIVGTAKGDDDATGEEVYRIPVESETEAEAIAKAKVQRESISGSGETFGIPEISAGTVITIDGVGEKFSGDYYVTRATHRIGASGYTMSFDVSGHGE